MGKYRIQLIEQRHSGGKTGRMVTRRGSEENCRNALLRLHFAFPPGATATFFNEFTVPSPEPVDYQKLAQKNMSIAQSV